MDQSKKPEGGPKLNFADFGSGLSDPIPPIYKQTEQGHVAAEDAPKTPEGELQFRRSAKTHSNFYLPGKSPGQPQRENQFRYCYYITKKLGK